MKRLDCPECQELLTGSIATGPRFWDIPETLKRFTAVFNDQECRGKHTLDAWVEDPT